MPVTAEQMRQIEEEAFSKGVRAEDLMENAGAGIAAVVAQFFPVPADCVAVCGKGNNAGDVLVAARLLAGAGWAPAVDCPFDLSVLSPLAAKKLRELQPFLSRERARFGPRPTILLDGLLGIGAQGNPRDPLVGKIREMARARERGAWVLAADIPSGLDSDTGEPATDCVRADCTAAIAAVKRGLLADCATDHVGRLAVVSLSALPTPAADEEIASSAALREWLPPRRFDTHKGCYGRIAIIAGSARFPGAARMCSAAAVHAGGGLVTLFTDRDALPLLGPALAPEVMLEVFEGAESLGGRRWDAIAVGPGLESGHREAVLELIRGAEAPMVVDAGALDMLAGDLSALDALRGPRLLTPHPGEMERLFPVNGRTRTKWASDFVEAHPVTLLLKGARTLVAQKDRPVSYNPTGHPGMGSGGMGDVLTGVAAALLGQGLSSRQAGVVGAWACGRAAEVRIRDGDSAESLSASQVIETLGAAFNDLRMGGY